MLNQTERRTSVYTGLYIMQNTIVLGEKMNNEDLGGKNEMGERKKDKNCIKRGKRP